MINRKKCFRGVVVPMVTPFLSSGAIDEKAIRRLVEHMLKAGTQGVFVLGTTGEAASIHPRDRLKVVKAAKEAIGGRAVLYAGVSGNCLKEAILAARAYQSWGADVVVSHPPFYYKPSDIDLEKYFIGLAEAIELPLMLYNIPKTTHVNIPLELVERLCHHPNIVGIKDSSNEEHRMTDLLKRFKEHKNTVVYCGCSSLMSLALKQGAAGLVPSSGNLWPEIYQSMWLAAMEEKWAEVDRQQRRSDEVGDAYQKGHTLGESLAFLKVLMEAKGLCGRMVLPPLRAVPDKEGAPCNVHF
jgi:dihydrodipicolinate synthase/N-acetylneuraminate lyase